MKSLNHATRYTSINRGAFASTLTGCFGSDVALPPDCFVRRLLPYWSERLRVTQPIRLSSRLLQNASELQTRGACGMIGAVAQHGLRVAPVT